MNPLERMDETIPSPLAGETAVTDEQRKVLAACVKQTEDLTEPCVEIGSFRGETTRFLAERTLRRIIAIDPYFEREGPSVHLQQFQKNTIDFGHVSLIRQTSGAAAPQIKRASFTFIDAVHEYAFVRFDIYSYAPKIVPGGILAFHDTDNVRYPGTRRAVWEFLNATTEFNLLYRVENLVALRRCSRVTGSS
jgi:Methyltransferase domain